MRFHPTKLIHPNHRLPPWLTEDAARERSNRLLAPEQHITGNVYAREDSEKNDTDSGNGANHGLESAVVVRPAPRRINKGPRHKSRRYH
jgi:hypothetical protein